MLFLCINTYSRAISLFFSFSLSNSPLLLPTTPALNNFAVGFFYLPGITSEQCGSLLGVRQRAAVIASLSNRCVSERLYGL